MPYEITIEQIRGTKVELRTLEGGHMLHLEQKEALKNELSELVK